MSVNIDSVYAASPADPSFEAVLRHCRVDSTGDDSSLAEVIEADGRWRLRKGRSVTLDRYLAAVPGLSDRTDALDAALEVTLRAMSGSSRIAAKSADELAIRYPALQRAIREAAALNAALWSTTGLRERLTPRPTLALPCDFGPMLSTGQRRYALQELLGQGSFGQVYRAEDRQLSEEGHSAIVAIKILSEAEVSEHERHRMIDEATKARRISHPNVVQVLDRGVSEDGADFIVYEFVGGGDLGHMSARSLPMPPRRAVALVAQIARGVHAAHAAGVIHCDLKPSNIMLAADGQPKVADFGIAVRMSDDGRVVRGASYSGRGPAGNIAFISPEQFRGEDAAFSVPSDVFALAGILYHLLTGRLPNGETRDEIAANHEVGAQRAAPSPRAIARSIDHDLDAICRRALASTPADRHASAAELAEDLERWQRREPIAWLHPSPLRRLQLWSIRKPALAAASAAIVILALGGAAVAGHYARQAEVRRAEAESAGLKAQMAQMVVDQENRSRAIALDYAGKVARVLREFQQDRRFLTDMLMQVWVFEYVFGPKALGDPDKAQQLWNSRVASIRSMLAELRSRGESETLEFLLWENALAFWLVSDHDHLESMPLIDHNLQQWRKMLVPTDPWLQGLETLRLCALVNRERDASAATSNSTQRAAALNELELDLQTAADQIGSSYPRSPLHYLALNCLADLNDPVALNRPERAAELRQQVHDLIENTLGKETGLAAEGRRTQAEIEAARRQATQPAAQP